jgi:2-hydroxychromene-2-carboxylate isomerase
MTKRSDRKDRRTPQQGFYGRSFQESELADLITQEDLDPGLRDEIDMLRVMTRRLFELANGIDDPQECIDTLRALGLASTRLAALLKTQDALAKNRPSEALEAIQSAIGEVLKEKGLQ